MMTSQAATARAGTSSRDRAKRHVRHFLADFAALEREYPDGYPKMIVRGEGAYVFDEDGNRLLDAGSHLGACQIGHGRAEVAQRIADQVKQLEFIALDAGISHIYVAELAERLSEIVICDEPVFSFTNSGSEFERARLQDRPHLPRAPRRAEPHQDHLAARLVSRLVDRRVRRRPASPRSGPASVRSRPTSSRPSRRPATPSAIASRRRRPSCRCPSSRR